jgi:hypothetical protein|tara:strand:+ start:8878 stop:9042 length:165 start_codon:yes stop_codon:yes gene_type:complete
MARPTLNFPSRTRSTAVDKGFPSRTRSAGVNFTRVEKPKPGKKLANRKGLPHGR